MSQTTVSEPAHPFHWPVPPFCQLGPKTDEFGGRPAEVEQLDGLKLEGEPLVISPETNTLWLRVDKIDMRTLALDNVRCIRLQQPLQVSVDSTSLNAIRQMPGDVTNEQPFTLHYADGKTFAGQTRGFQKTEDGLFLFPLEGADEIIRCYFIPRVQVGELQVGGIPQYDPNHTALVTPEELTEALKNRHKRPSKRLGELLLEAGLIDTLALDEALAEQQQNREKKLGQILLEKGLVTLKEIQRALADKLGIPYVNVVEFQIEPEALELVNGNLAKEHQILPLSRENGNLMVAVENPLDFEFEHELEFILNMNVVAVIGEPKAIAERITTEYGNWNSATSALASDAELQHTNLEELAQRLAREAKHEQPGSSDDARESTIRVSDNTLVRLVNKMIMEAYQQRASDIHIESTRNSNTRIRFRIDGVLQDYLELQPYYRNALVSRIKVMASLDIAEHRHGQDGKINFSRFGPLPIQLRVAIVPTTDGAEDVVLRILGATEPLPLDKLDLGEDYLHRLLDMIQRHHGLILVCGPTGSGKTTTLHSILRHINQPDRKIWTAEDPVEITQPGLRQVQVNARIGWTFANAMRSFLRADPDVIMVGEMRDAETTGIGIEASLTGHLVFSTLHTNSAAESIVRLLELGMDPFNFSDALIGIMSQRLARRLCTHCKQPRSLNDAQVEELAAEYCTHTELKPAAVIRQWRKQYWANKQQPQVFEAEGCEQCDNGYHGRIGIYELLSASDEIQHLIRSQGTVPEIRTAALKAGMRLLRQDALDKVLNGTIDLVWARAVSS